MQSQVTGDYLLSTAQLIVKKVHVYIHKALNSRGVIRCRDLSDMTEEELCEELREQGVVAVRRVMLKTGATITPTNTLFLTFNRLDMPEVLLVGFLFKCPIHCGVLGATRSATRAIHAVLDRYVYGVENINTGESVRDPRCAPIAMVRTKSQILLNLEKQKKEIQCVRVEKRIPFPEGQVPGQKLTIFVIYC